MHMADALISPAVGGTLWVFSGGLIALCARRVGQRLHDSIVPMMGVLGAFVFTAQMINFAIPGTGSSGHMGGGLLLAVLLGPHAALLVMASVLTVQAFFFADGGLLALGCNIFNLGFLPAFAAYPLYQVIAQKRAGGPVAWAAAIVAGIVGLQLGAFGVVLETTASGIAELPFGAFILTMLPVHLAIGIVEGMATAAVVSFVARVRPEALSPMLAGGALPRLKSVLVSLAIVAVALGGAASWLASTRPDGLEWSISKVAGKKAVLGPAAGVHRNLADVQKKTAFLPDYGFKAATVEATPSEHAAPERESWPAVDAGTSVSGIIGGLMTLSLALLIGVTLRALTIRRATGND